MNEEQYWKDFLSGRSLEKYGVKIIKTFMLDRWQSQDVAFFANEHRKQKQKEIKGE
jgi:hypothetical protein